MTSREPGPIVFLGGWSRWRREKAAERETLQTNRRISDVDPSWQPTQWLQTAQGEYGRLVQAITAGDEATLKGLLSIAALASYRLGAAQAAAETGCRQGARIVKWIGGPTLVSSRALKGRTEVSAVDLEGRPDWAQVTVRFTTLQAPVATRLSAAALEAAVAAARSPSAAESPLPCWRPVLHEPSGRVYWVDLVSGRRQWEKPLQSQTVAMPPGLPFRIDTAGSEREPVAAPASAGDAEGGSVARVTHNVTWERCFKAGAPDSWRIARL